MHREVYLHGHLGKQFGECHSLDVANPRQAVSAFLANYKGDKRKIIHMDEHDLW